MKIEMNHQFYQSPNPGTPMKSSFSLLIDARCVGREMSETQARQVCKNLGLEFPENSTLSQWTMEIEEQSQTWSHVLKFAERMEAKLEKNRHKGDREGWLKMSAEELLEYQLDKIAEMQIAYNAGHVANMVEACNDIANFAMMIADWYIEHSQLNKTKLIDN